MTAFDLVGGVVVTLLFRRKSASLEDQSSKRTFSTEFHSGNSASATKSKVRNKSKNLFDSQRYSLPSFLLEQMVGGGGN